MPTTEHMVRLNSTHRININADKSAPHIQRDSARKELATQKKQNITFAQFGAAGEEVKEVQLLLKRKGYAVTVDGIFGPETKKAVMAFQKANELQVDGFVGPQTATKLTGNMVNVNNCPYILNFLGIKSSN